MKDVTWMAFEKAATEKQMRQRFKMLHNAVPAQIVDGGAIWLVGPVGGQMSAKSQASPGK